jgi:pyrimidine operon attenuation protein / uracil phosphoribosyltransferase
MPTRGKSPNDKPVAARHAGQSTEPSSEKAHLMTESEIERTLIHLAHDIVDKTEEKLDLVVIGVRRRGEILAERLAKKVRQMTKVDVPVGSLDVELYRDDRPVTSHPQSPSQVPFSIAGKDVILVDDVLFTGRTARAALEAIFDHGRPRRVRLCVLIDRGYRELPIEAEFVGKRVTVGPQQVIEVRLREEDRVEKVVLLEKN